MRPRSLRTVALLVETSRAYGRGILRGIARYARTQGRWSILFQDWQLEDPLPSWLGKGRCDGVIAHITTAAFLRALRRLGIPTIGVGQARPAGLARLGRQRELARQRYARNKVQERQPKRYGGFMVPADRGMRRDCAGRAAVGHATPWNAPIRLVEPILVGDTPRGRQPAAATPRKIPNNIES